MARKDPQLPSASPTGSSCSGPAPFLAGLHIYMGPFSPFPFHSFTPCPVEHLDASLPSTELPLLEGQSAQRSRCWRSGDMWDWGWDLRIDKQDLIGKATSAWRPVDIRLRKFQVATPPRSSTSKAPVGLVRMCSYWEAAADQGAGGGRTQGSTGSREARSCKVMVTVRV